MSLLQNSDNEGPKPATDDIHSLLLSAIVDSSDDAIISKDLTGRITSWNKGAERIFGYSVNEAVGNPITMLIPADRQDEEPQILARLQRGERVDHFETIRRRKDGTNINVSVTISPIRNSQACASSCTASRAARQLSTAPAPIAAATSVAISVATSVAISVAM